MPSSPGYKRDIEQETRDMLAESLVDVPLRMSWDSICRLACRCTVLGITVDQYVDLALRNRLGN